MNEYLLCEEGICKTITLSLAEQSGDPGIAMIGVILAFGLLMGLFIAIFIHTRKQRKVKAMLAQKLKLTPEEEADLMYL